MNTKQIEYILELAKTKNFNRAAENMFVSQPTMSYQINLAEEEIGFRIFDRSGKGAEITPAGEQFITTLKDIHSQYKRAVEHGQNFSVKYRDNIRIGMSVRAALYYLPEIMKQYEKEDPSISITPLFDYHHYLERFLAGETDIMFAIKDVVRHIPDIAIHPLFDSGLFLVCRSDDPLASHSVITDNSLEGRTLMIGEASPAPLKAVQKRIIASTDINYFNSPDYDTSLTYVASGKAVVIAPGFLNDHNPSFSWIPFDCKEKVPCVLCTHSSETRKTVKDLVVLIQQYYSGKENL